MRTLVRERGGSGRKERNDEGVQRMNILGIDVGGTGIKGAVVETATGELARAPPHRVAAPGDARVRRRCDRVAGRATPLVRSRRHRVPAAIQRGVARTAANIDLAFIGLPVADHFSRQTGCPVDARDDRCRGSPEYMLNETTKKKKKKKKKKRICSCVCNGLVLNDVGP